MIMQIVLDVDNDNLTKEEIEALHPKMEQKAREIFGKKFNQIGYGHCGQYPFTMQVSENKLRKLPAQLRRLAANTTGMGSLEITEISICGYKKKEYYRFHEIIKR